MNPYALDFSGFAPVFEALRNRKVEQQKRDTLTQLQRIFDPAYTVQASPGSVDGPLAQIPGVSIPGGVDISYPNMATGGMSDIKNNMLGMGGIPSVTPRDPKLVEPPTSYKTMTAPTFREPTPAERLSAMIGVAAKNPQAAEAFQQFGAMNTLSQRIADAPLDRRLKEAEIEHKTGIAQELKARAEFLRNKNPDTSGGRWGAAYRAAIESGKTPDEAWELAKDVLPLHRAVNRAIKTFKAPNGSTYMSNPDGTATLLDTGNPIKEANDKFLATPEGAKLDEVHSRFKKEMPGYFLATPVPGKGYKVFDDEGNHVGYYK